MNMVDPNRIVLLSDPHIAADPTTVDRGANMADRLRRVVDDVCNLSPAPVYTLCNGDLAHASGEPGDYEHLQRLMSPLRSCPIIKTLGNHDSVKGFARAPEVELLAGDATLVTLNSLDPTMPVAGVLGPSKLRHLHDRIEGERGPLLLCLHHPPLPDPLAGEPHNLQDHGAFWQVVAPHRHVKAVFYGHLHRFEHHTRPDGIHLVGLPATSYVFDESQPWGYLVGDLRPDGMDLTLRAFDDHPRDGERLRLDWRV